MLEGASNSAAHLGSLSFGLPLSPPRICGTLLGAALSTEEADMKAKSLLTTPGWGGAAQAVLSEGPGENTTRRMLAHPLPSQPRTRWESRKPWGTPRRRGKKSTGSGGSRSRAFQGSALLTSGIQELAGAPQSLTSDLAFRRLSVLTGQTSAGHAKPLHAHATAAHFSSLSLALPCLTPPTFTGPRMGSSVG